MVFALVVAIGFFAVSLPGREVWTTDLFAFGQYGPGFGDHVESLHGWPWTFAVRPGPPSASQQGWGFWFSLWNPVSGVTDFRLSPLLGDVLVGCLVVLLLGVCFNRWRRRHRRLLQFHLIDVCGLFILVAVALSYWATNAREFDRERRIVRQIVPPIDAEWTPGGVTWLRAIIGEPPFIAFDRVVRLDATENVISRLASLPSLRALRILGYSPSQSQIDSLAGLPHLEALNLASLTWRPEYKATELRLPPLPHLRGLNLHHARFSGGGLENLTGVEVLDLTGTDIDDAAMPKFRRLRNLKVLCLAGTKITDAGLEHLKGLTQLRKLSLGREISDQTVKGLREALPNCKIERR
ncbi:MAG: hypothetical protein ABFC96_07360 [Thermoguttaceae bacterium]